MADGRVFIFWTYDHWLSWIRAELASGRLRQGWGGADCALLDERGRLRAFHDWQRSFAQYAEPIWRDPPLTDDQTRTRFSILKSMLEMDQGDLVVVPRVPNEGIFTTARVTNGYRFDGAHFGGCGPVVPANDGGHVVEVDRGSLKEHSYRDSLHSKAIRSRFRFYRRAVTQVRDEGYANLIRQIHDEH